MASYDPIIDKDGTRYFYRFSSSQRVQHVILFSTVIILAVTGFPLRHPEQPWAQMLYDFMGGPTIVPYIHRVTGLVLLALFVFHTAYWMYLFFINDILPLKRENKLTLGSGMRAFFSQEMVPNRNDVRDFIDTWKFLFYVTNRPPQPMRMSWREKFDYFAPYWGVPILGPAGAALWFREEISQVAPGWVLNIAYIMHTDEALLAVLFLFFVHWYNVHYAPEKFPGASVWLSGYLSEDEMIHEHYGEYVRVMTDQGLENEIKPQHFGLRN
jgi:cytochrome b subunit of formate dehydrogenase